MRKSRILTLGVVTSLGLMACGSSSTNTSSSTTLAAAGSTSAQTATTSAGTSAGGTSTTATAASGTSAATAAPTPVAGTKVLKVGVLAPYTGDLAYYGEEMKSPVDLLFKQINAAGGLKVGDTTYTLEAVAGDTQGQPQQAVTVVQQMTTRDGIKFFIGPAFSGEASAVDPFMESSGAFYILASAVALGPTKHPTVFRNQALLDTAYSQGILDYIKAHPELKKIAVLTDKTHTGLVQNTDAFVKGVKDLGRDVVANDQFTRGDTDFRASITTLIGEAPDLVVLRGYPAEGVAFRKQAKELGAKWDEMWSTKIADADLLKLDTQADLNGLKTCYDPGLADQAKQGDPVALQAYKDYGANLSVFFDNIWDATQIMTTGMVKAGSIDPKAVAAAEEKLTPTDVKTFHKYLPQANGLLFQNHEISLKSLCVQFGDGGWTAIPGQ